MTVAPPSFDGGVHVKVACPFPACTVKVATALGTTTVDDGVAVASFSAPAPTAFTARILNVYAVPLVRLEKVYVTAVAAAVSLLVQLSFGGYFKKD